MQGKYGHAVVLNTLGCSDSQLFAVFSSIELYNSGFITVWKYQKITICLFCNKLNCSLVDLQQVMRGHHSTQTLALLSGSLASK